MHSTRPDASSTMRTMHKYQWQEFNHNSIETVFANVEPIVL